MWRIFISDFESFNACETWEYFRLTWMWGDVISDELLMTDFVANVN